jgi:hypothetical protein
MRYLTIWADAKGGAAVPACEADLDRLMRRFAGDESPDGRLFWGRGATKLNPAATSSLDKYLLFLRAEPATPEGERCHA